MENEHCNITSRSSNRRHKLQKLVSFIAIKNIWGLQNLNLFFAATTMDGHELPPYPF
jgi:hypothetical protein